MHEKTDPMLSDSKVKARGYTWKCNQKTPATVYIIIIKF